MFHSSPQGLGKWLPHPTVLYARGRALFSRHPLPPGRWIHLDRVERTDRLHLLHLAEVHGPVFKALAWGEFWVCVIGLGLCRRFIREHGEHLHHYTLDLTPLIPKGCIRAMDGPDHHQYRRALGRAIVPADLDRHQAGLERIAAEALAGYAGREAGHQDSPEAYIATLNAISSGMLIQLFFGAEAGSPFFDSLLAAYRRLGPYGLVWNIGDAQRQAFAEISDLLRRRLAAGAGTESPLLPHSILGRLHQAGALDDDLLGNLIYMVEMGRYDVYSLFRWLTKYGADFPERLRRIRSERGTGSPADRLAYAEAFVLEALRTDQSERLLRIARRDLVFDGLLIPKGAMIRLCLWESHKSSESFQQPFEFQPERFLDRAFTLDQFAPFGLDEHQCPFGDVSLRLGRVFLETLAAGYHLQPIGDGLPVRGAYHWEPASRFSVRLEPRTGTSPETGPPADRPGAPGGESTARAKGTSGCPFHGHR